MTGPCTPRRIPVLIGFTGASAKHEAWGHLSGLAATAARISLLTPLAKDEELFLSFELAGESFSAMTARADWTEIDADGYILAEVSFTDKAAQRRLAKALLELLSTVPG